METQAAIRTRRSIRDFDPGRKVSDRQLHELFELVGLSPSSYNLQAWEFLVIRAAAGKKKLRACAEDQRHVEEASAAIIVLADTYPIDYARTTMADRVKLGYYDQQKAQATLAKITAWKGKGAEYRKLKAVRSVSLACMALMLAARDMGLDSCPIEGFDSGQVRKGFGIPGRYEIAMLICLGYRKQEPRQRLPRKEVKDIVHLEALGRPLQ
ncbi:MAG: nitroreductase family protein [Candidatus Aenigmarchaeota archaeon]|nr:nitroreductase family protein [Candidatus Aenigmarchaeota archaeon]